MKKKQRSAWTKQLVFVAIVALLVVGYVVWDINFDGPLTRLFNNREAIIELVERRWFLAPFVYILLQIFQTVIAPIPGGAVGPIGGFLFGWWGVLWTMIGSTVGAYIVFYLSRRFGRTLILKILKKDEFEKFDMIPEQKAEMVIFALFLIPGLPDDTICYIAGLSKVPIKKLLVCWAIGRLPAVVVANYLGMGVGEGDMVKILTILGIIALILGFIAIEKEQILNLLRGKKKELSRKKR